VDIRFALTRESVVQSWLGVGVDLIRVERVAKLSDAARHRLFLPAELETASTSLERKHEKLAGRFAAKEAVLKALGTGLAQGIRWHDIEISQNDLGAPVAFLHGKASEIAQGMGVKQVLLSISHEGGLAIAFAALSA
jgi:holo-[acyl-carrier protein] synthase